MSKNDKTSTPIAPATTGPEKIKAGIADLEQSLRSAAEGPLQHIDCNPENIEQGLARLVLSLIEMLRKLLERQAIRRMEGSSLSDQQVEEMGVALMKLEQKIQELAAHFNLKPEDLSLDLGPLGKTS